MQLCIITRLNSLTSHPVRAPPVSKVCFAMNFCICRDTELWAIVDGRIIQSNLVSSGLTQEVVVQEGRGDQKGLYREQVEDDYMQFPSSK